MKIFAKPALFLLSLALGLTTPPERSRVEDQFGWERRGQALRGGPSVHILRSYLMSAG